MSTAEIIAELPKLAPEERQQVFERLCELQEQDMLAGVGPTEHEKQILREAVAEFERDGDRGRPWRDVVADLRAAGRK